MPNAYTETTVEEIPELSASSFPPIIVGDEIESGHGTVKIGTVVGRVTIGGKLAPYDATNTDGSEDAVTVLNRTIETGDTAGSSLKCGVYRVGHLDGKKLIGLDAAAITALDARTIIVEA